MIKVIDCEQGSEEWRRVRMKMPTGSRFKDVLAEGNGRTRLHYMRQIVGEHLNNLPMVSHTNKHTERGKEREPIILAEYQFLTGHKVDRVGFMHNDLAGISPDGLIGKDGMVEVKDALPHILVEIIDRGSFPPEHRAQCQGGLWISQRKWCDLVVGCEGTDAPYIIRTFRQESYIAELEREVKRFRKDLADMLARVKGYRR